jgi:hypothetical protein
LINPNFTYFFSGSFSDFSGAVSLAAGAVGSDPPNAIFAC